MTSRLITFGKLLALLFDPSAQLLDVGVHTKEAMACACLAMVDLRPSHALQGAQAGCHQTMMHHNSARQRQAGRQACMQAARHVGRQSQHKRVFRS